MRIENNININFGQKIPTSTLFKVGTGIFDFNDAKTLCVTFDDKFPGHVGYYKKALNLTNNIANKNEQVSQMIKSVNELNSKNDKLKVIGKIVETVGNEIDVVI